MGCIFDGGIKYSGSAKWKKRKDLVGVKGWRM